MKFDDLVTELAAWRPWQRKYPRKKEVRALIKQFTGLVKTMRPGESLIIAGLGTFKKVTRAPREIVGFDGETVYQHPATDVLTFREFRKKKAETKKRSRKRFHFEGQVGGFPES